jgi:hypothetical protein
VPVCSNCGGSDFVWAENVRTGGLGRGGLSLRSGGELALGTRVCRGCGHADLFVKDPTILRQPHTWRPGEFVAIPPRGGGPSRPASPTPAAPAPLAPPAAPVPAPAPPMPPAPAAPTPAPSGGSSGPSAPEPEAAAAAEMSAPTAPDAGSAPSDTGTKKTPRRKSSKAKAGSPPVTPG